MMTDEQRGVFQVLQDQVMLYKSSYKIITGLVCTIEIVVGWFWLCKRDVVRVMYSFLTAFFEIIETY